MLHIGIIPDGNRRYARKNNIDTLEGYKIGFRKIQTIINEIYDNNGNSDNIDKIIDKNKIINNISKDNINNINNVNGITNIDEDEINRLRKNIIKCDNGYNIDEITLYICSVDNIKKRKTKDILDLMEVMYDCINEWSSEESILYKLKIKVRIVGNVNLLPDKSLVRKIKNIARNTKKHDKLFLNLAIGYSGKDDIVNAVNKFINNNGNSKITHNDNSKITHNDITNNMVVKRNIDLVIRTGKEKRTSGFFPWNTLYSEWFFVNKYCPEIDIYDIENVLIEYSKRERRFGK